MCLAGLLLGAPCSGPVVHQVDLGHGLTLRYWQVAQQRVSRSEFAFRFQASLQAASATAGETLVSIASDAPHATLVDAALRFPAVAAGETAGSADDFVLRQDRAFAFDPARLRFRALDRFGGDLSIETTATGRFRLERIDGRDWLITPDGHAFFSSGVNHVTFRGDYSPPIDRRPYHEAVLARYGSEAGWAAATEERLRGWNVNTVGAWSNDHDFPTLPYTPIMSLHQAAPAIPGWPTGQTGKAIRDYFDPAFAASIGGRTGEAVSCAADPYCLGVYSDNELPFGPSVLQIGTFVDAYLTLPAGAPGKLALQGFFEDRYAGDIDAMNAAWSLDLASFDDIQQLDALPDDDAYCNADGRRADRQAFTAMAAERYFAVAGAALDAVSPELLYLGARQLAVFTAPAIYQAAAPHVDVISINDYDWDPEGRGLFQSEGAPYGYLFLDDAVSDLATVHALTGRPLMITEWTIRTPTPDVDVLFPPFIPTVDTQSERADRYQAFMDALLERPYMVGAHWFKFHDQPDTGRGDGENSLFGTVDIHDDPYPELTERMAFVNARLYDPVAAPAGAQATLVPRAVGDPELGLRRFSITAPQQGRSGFFVYILPGTDLALSIDGGPLWLEAGAPDAQGVADLRLASDAVVAVTSVVGDVACIALRAQGSFGELSCDGGQPHDVSVSLPAGPATGLTPDTQAFLGAPAGPGAATLLAPMRFTQLPPGALPAECTTTTTYGPEFLAALTTATVTTTKGASTFDTRGEPFHCGADGSGWQAEDGPGMLALGMPLVDGRVPGGDLAAAFRLADRAVACLP